MTRYQTSSTLVFGAFLAEMPTVVGIPAGKSIVKIRARMNDLTQVFLRDGKSVELWNVEYADKDQKTIRPTYPVAQNLRT